MMSTDELSTREMCEEIDRIRDGNYLAVQRRGDAARMQVPDAEHDVASPRQDLLGHLNMDAGVPCTVL
jgi:hypothetical protein